MLKIATNMIVPDFLKGNIFYEPTEEIQNKIAKINSNVNIYFYEGEKSFRYQNNIYINIRGTYWLNYNKIINPKVGIYNLEAESFEEVLTLRCLHEIGHIERQHEGSLDENDGKIKDEARTQICEIEAWEWANNFKKNNPVEFEELKNAFKTFLSSHTYADKDWKDTFNEQKELKN